jgi:hypothetical protein
MRGVRFPAARTTLLPRHPQLPEPALERSALHELDHHQEHEVEDKGKVRHRCDSANEAIEASNPTKIAASVKREFSTGYVGSTIGDPRPSTEASSAERSPLANLRALSNKSRCASVSN